MEARIGYLYREVAEQVARTAEEYLQGEVLEIRDRLARNPLEIWKDNLTIFEIRKAAKAYQAISPEKAEHWALTIQVQMAERMTLLEVLHSLKVIAHLDGGSRIDFLLETACRDKVEVLTWGIEGLGQEWTVRVYESQSVWHEKRFFSKKEAQMEKRWLQDSRRLYKGTVDLALMMSIAGYTLCQLDVAATAG